MDLETHPPRGTLRTTTGMVTDEVELEALIREIASRLGLGVDTVVRTLQKRLQAS